MSIIFYSLQLSNRSHSTITLALHLPIFIQVSDEAQSECIFLSLSSLQLLPPARPPIASLSGRTPAIQDKPLPSATTAFITSTTGKRTHINGSLLGTTGAVSFSATMETTLAAGANPKISQDLARQSMRSSLAVVIRCLIALKWMYASIL